jgi:hypothetical protein
MFLIERRISDALDLPRRSCIILLFQMGLRRDSRVSLELIFFFFLARHNCVILTVACVHCDGYSVTTCQHRLAAKIGKMISELL